MKKRNDNNLSINEVRGRLFELIFAMPATKTRELLQELEKRGQDKHEEKEKRKHSRKRTFIQVDCSGEKCAFTDFIQNISAGGLYIETQMPLLVDQELSMTFSSRGSKDPVKITGKVVRVDPKGIGVQFDELVPNI